MTGLPRVLTQRDLVVIVVGTVIGSGIFIVPATVLAQAGGAVGPALLVWVTGGLLSLLGALCYAELGAMTPKAGGLYVYIRDAFGTFPAFLFGWTMFLVISSGSVATLAVAGAGYLEEFVTLGPWGRRAASVLLVAVVAWINVRGTRESAGVQTWATGIKVGAIVVMAAALIGLGRGLAASAAALWPERVTPALFSGAGLGMVGVLWAYEGWQYVTYSAGEALEPQRTFPRGIAVGTAALVVVYLVANVGYLAALGPARMQDSPRVAAEAVGAILGAGAGKLIAAAIVVSIFSAANGVTLTAPRVYFAMAQDGVFFRRLAEVHPRFQTPAFAVAASSAWAAALAMWGSFEQLLTYVVFTGWVFYGLGALSVVILRRIQPDLPRPFRVPGYPWPVVLFVASAAVIVVNTLVNRPLAAVAGLVVVLAGAPAFVVWRRASRRAAAGIS